MIRDRFIMVIKDPSVKQKLQLITDLSLEKAVTIARQDEQVKSQMREQLHENVAEARVVPRVAGRYAKDKRSTYCTPRP